MAGKHTGWSDASGGPDGFGRFPRLDIAFREGAEGNPAANPHTAGTPEALAYTAGAGAADWYEVAPGGTRVSVVEYSAEDAGQEYVGFSWDNATNSLVGNIVADELNIGLSFDGVTIAQGATVQSAVLQIPFLTVDAGAPEFTVGAEDTDTAAVVDGVNLPSTWTITTATASMTGILPSTTHEVTITSVIQELVDRPGWSGAGERVNIECRTALFTGTNYVTMARQTQFAAFKLVITV